MTEITTVSEGITYTKEDIALNITAFHTIQSRIASTTLL